MNKKTRVIVYVFFFIFILSSCSPKDNKNSISEINELGDAGKENQKDQIQESIEVNADSYEIEIDLDNDLNMGSENVSSTRNIDLDLENISSMRNINFDENISNMQEDIADYIDTVKTYIINTLDESYDIEIQTFVFDQHTSISNLAQIFDYASENKPVNENYYKIYSGNSAENRQGQNIIATKKSKVSDEMIILSAHYDSEIYSSGIYDNTTGISVLLELSRQISNLNFKVDICFIFFSNEEDGFVGSRYYAGQINDNDLESILGNINIDCVGHKDMGKTSMFTSDGAGNEITDLFENEYISIYKTFKSDHSSFLVKNIPSVLIAQEYILQDKLNLIEDTVENISVDELNLLVDMLKDILIENYGLD